MPSLPTLMAFIVPIVAPVATVVPDLVAILTRDIQPDRLAVMVLRQMGVANDTICPTLGLLFGAVAVVFDAVMSGTE